ncbi:MAG TPA: acetyl ornithine aminotransferase family protein [Candidatus Angelobacter sp.]|jgi:4-aminobutyrate aminotransferase|nr:acetyl ornithine aminotransferase family protein [Candidatus Angelobacter sp.]HKT50619.1 acetyl ornithine aminotransferase family protein [Candidatus Angelobacter sp.]
MTMPTQTMTSAGPRIRTKLPGPNAQKVLQGDAKFISPSYTRSYPLVAKAGRGCIVEDVDGNEFLDFSSGIAVCSTGHCHPEVVAAIQKQAGELIHMSGTDFYYENMITLADRLAKLAPMSGPVRVYYGNSGTEAIEAAMKMARYHTRRQGIIAFYGAFHGRTMGALSMTASKVQQRRRFFPVVPGVAHVPYPYVYRRPEGMSESQFIKDCVSFIEDRVFKTIMPPEECAAIFVEPIQGEGGYVPAPKEYMQELRRICDKHGILLVADEVQSGAGRTGKMWAIEHTGVEPDIITIAKGIASGMPLGVTLARAEIMDWVPGSHASTFGGNPICIEAALATLNVLEREAMHNAEVVGAHILKRISRWVETHPMVGDVRGHGLMIGIEIVKDKKTRATAHDERDRIVDLAFERGLLFLGAGENSIRIAPPLIVTQEQADIAMDVLEECIGIIEKER